jgi:hypothetical protein
MAAASQTPYDASSRLFAAAAPSRAPAGRPSGCGGPAAIADAVTDRRCRHPPRVWVSVTDKLVYQPGAPSPILESFTRTQAFTRHAHLHFDKDTHH